MITYVDLFAKYNAVKDAKKAKINNILSLNEKMIYSRKEFAIVRYT